MPEQDRAEREPAAPAQLPATYLTDSHHLPTGLRVEHSPRWVRVFFAGVPIADSKRVLLVFEPRHMPEYWFPREDVRTDLLEKSGTDTASIPVTHRWSVRVEDRVAENAAWSYPEPGEAREEMRDHIAFVWDKMDAWYEEDEEVFFHPRHPNQRVDAIQSSRHVRVEIDGHVVADTMRPTLLFETGLPTRFYIPKLDVRMDLLEPTDKTSRCPYKGVATYWSLRLGDTVHENVVWSYPEPIPECPKIENLLAFYNEKADIWVDGELQPKPQTAW
ncbi:MAG: DUF427 domain-containing protein [Thermoleophilia bacterium]